MVALSVRGVGETGWRRTDGTAASLVKAGSVVLQRDDLHDLFYQILVHIELPLVDFEERLLLTGEPGQAGRVCMRHFWGTHRDGRGNGGRRSGESRGFWVRCAGGIAFH